MEKTRTVPNTRRLCLDVDKAIRAPSLLEIAEAIQRCRGVEVCNITVTGIDIETVGTDVTIEGSALDYEEIVRAIEKTGAVVHGLDQIVAGDRMLEHIPRAR
jgi:hypothetical protein